MADILKTLAPLIDRINETMSDLIARDEEVAARIGQYSFQGGGKRLRPLIFCLVSQALGREVTPEALETAAAFEFLHMATLLHDDIVDGASTRRGREAAHLVFGVPETVLAGDYLLAKSAVLGAATGNLTCVKNLSSIVAAMSVGELTQMEMRHRVDLSEEEYFGIIHRKTAVLMEGAALSAAQLAGADEELEAPAARFYGEKLGLAFQVMDDILDYESDEATFGKPVGHDLAEGKITLPFIRARDNLAMDNRAGDKLAGEERERLRSLAGRDFDPAHWPEVRRLVEKGRGISGAHGAAQALAAEALSAIVTYLSPSPAREHLAQLAVYVIDRNF